MCLTAPHNISDQDTDESSSGESEICLTPIQECPDPTLVGNSIKKQLTALVSTPDTTDDITVTGGSQGVVDIMSGIQSMEMLQEELEPIREQQQVHPNQEFDHNPNPIIKLEDEEIDVVGVEDTWPPNMGPGQSW